MPTVKKLQFANGVVISAPQDLALETATNSLPVYVDDAAYVADETNDLQEGSIYLNTTEKAPRMYIGGVWRTGIMQNNPTDATKRVVLDTDGASAGAVHTLDFNGTSSRVYTFPDTSATVVLTLGAQEIQDKTIKNGFLDGTKIRNGALDVEAAGNLTIGSTVGANNLTLGGATSNVQIPGNLTVSGTTTTLNTDILDVEDKNITVNKGGNDATSAGAGLTVDRTGTKGSLIYDATTTSKWKAGNLSSEIEIADISSSQTFTNKTINASNNTISNLTSAMITGAIAPNKGGTGVANNNAATLTRTGNFDLNITTTNISSVTMPTSGVLATTTLPEDLLNKKISSTSTLSGALQLPIGTTDQRLPAEFTSSQGMIRYNTTQSTFEGFDGIDWGAIGGSGGGGTTDTITQANAGFVVGDVLYLNGFTYAKASAAASNTAEVVGVVSKILDSNAASFTFELTLSGEVTNITSPTPLVVGEVYFLSATTPGLLTVTEPTTIGHVSLPVGVASSSSSLYVAPKRGVVVGATNARTNISLANNATTTVQNVSAYEAGELSGWVSIYATTPLRFYVAAQFSKNGAANNYNISYQVSGDTPPAGFLVSVTAAGLIQVTLPAITGFGSASITYGLDVAAIGTSLPLSVSARNVIGDTSGTAVPTGMIGEVILANPAATVTPASSGNLATICSITLTPGVWMISAMGRWLNAGSTPTAFTSISGGIGTTTSAVITNYSFSHYPNQVVNGATTGVILPNIVNISSNTTYYLLGGATYSALNGGAWSAFSQIQAVRIA